ncbi:MAG: glycosyltransferase, partial [Trebonia sp.]
VYYGRDDWTAFRRNSHLARVLRQAQEEMRGRGVTICAVSRVLADRLAGPGEGIVIPNGIDEATWLTPAPPPAVVRDLPRPCGIYAGTIDDRLDVDGVRGLVEAGGLASVALAGPVADPEIGRRLRAEPRIRLLGNLSQRELVGALMWADVCLLPHAVTRLTEAMSPLKLYEYLASGTPVVATDLAPVRGAGPRVRLVRDGDYRGAVEKALADGSLSEDERVAVVRASSWRGRHARLLDAMFGRVSDIAVPTEAGLPSAPAVGSSHELP